MDHQDFNFYNNENDGYRGGFGDYVELTPADPGTAGGGGKPPKKKKTAGRVIALLLACAIVGGGAGVGGAALYGHMAPQSSGGTTIYEQARPQVQTVVNTNKGQPMTAQQLYAANLDSCVGITVSTTTTNYFGQTSTSAASGSGFVLTEDGYLVTNYHVIEEAAKDSSVSIEVSFSDGKKYSAKLMGGEQDSDVAVLKIEATGLTAVTLGDSSQLVVGEAVYAIGNPLGELTYSLTDGIVSALDRLITTSSTNAKGQLESTTLNVLQTNCAINPGNSGGPLFDSYGNVIGITTAKYTQSTSGVSAEGLGFALPINDVKEILSDLIEHGYVTGKPYMGVQVNVVSSDAQHYGIPAGASIEYVAEDSCAQKAGLQVGDIITAIDDTAIDSPSALTAILASDYKAGDTATFTVQRKQATLHMSITFDEKNLDTEAANQTQQEEEPEQQQDSESGNYYQYPFGNFPW